MSNPFEKKLLPLLVALACTSAGADDYYVVAPVKGKTYNASAITVTLMTSSMPAGVVGEGYSYNLSQVLAVSGDPTFTGYGVKWAAVGNLPAGLSLDMYTGVLSGTPSSAGSSTFDVTATYKTKTGTQTYTLTVQLKEAIPRWESTSLDFGATTPYYEVSRSIKLHNDGDANGNWASLSGVSGNLTADASGCAVVAPKQFCTVTFTYLPTAVGSVSLDGIKPAGVTMGASLSVAGSAGPRIVAVSPAVAGKSTWNLDADGPLVLPTAGTWTVTPSAAVGMYVKLWGAGGGGGGFDAAPVYSGLGGGGSYVDGVYRAAPSALTFIVGGGGGAGATSAVSTGGGTAGSNGGGLGGNAGSAGSSGSGGGGGGRTEILLGSTQVACAGGGGGGGGDGNATTNGNTHGNYYTGFTASKVGGSGINRSTDGGGPGGGGGGCNGGAASGNFPMVDSNGEGGSAGQSSAPGLNSATITPAAAGATPARSTDPDLGTTNAKGGNNAISGVAATAGAPGKIVIR